LGAILHYLTRFPERLHHPAEDLYLFAPLRAKTSESGEVLDLLEQEHGQGHQREETTILPLAERLFSEAEWVAAAAGFAANADPCYGGDMAQDFKALFRRIVNQTPAPEGLGREET
jgi:hemerythrin-like domain-containing protein